ncbi:phosphotransferase family protein [Catenuloplanes atrovinosus]|uniref:Aminoglycoside phosphotransferase domain-containing protein n=1 Tax=Catenuloplanes atrovinosus TaxID=137266 RepID=A0AAE3YUV6_9ACTN|nr:phosphotransferase [Catenuloplanes atrovinosus]MDR7278376.1 hypothetical protein [Catenuloplanes atrovinosus]
MMRSDWTALPDAVTTEIADRVGRPFTVRPAAGGDHAEIAAAVTGPAGTVFIKAASGGPESVSFRSLRYELAATGAVGRWPPAVLWQIETGGWLAGAFEHLDGRHPDLSPGGPDLDLLAEALEDLGEIAAPDGTWFTPAGRLGWEHPTMDGGTVVHSDLNPANLIVTATGLRIVDWAYATRAAPWLELAMLVQWLIGSGHTPAAAEDWLARFPAWATIDRGVLDDFALHSAAKWSARAQQGTAGWVHDLATWNGAWAAYRRR